jgi:hypothetical protein
MPAVKKPVKQPDIQLIANAVITDRRGRVLLTRYDADESRWWLPGSNLLPYEQADPLPAMAHGKWELGVIAKALAA